MDPNSHIPSHKAEGCTNSAIRGNGDLATQSHMWQRKNMKKNGNWDDVSRKWMMHNVEVGSNLQTISWRWGVPITSFQNRITQLWKNEKSSVLRKKREVALLKYVKKM